MDLEGILLSEISQTEKDKYRMTSLMCGIQNSILRETENIPVVVRGRNLEEGEMGECG